ncbi:MAG: hypothetical protein AB1589_22475 [Cyanobacteriota bacterium]
MLHLAWSSGVENLCAAAWRAVFFSLVRTEVLGILLTLQLDDSY